MSTPMIIFLVIATGYLVGAIKVKGFNLGSSGVLIMALIFGHFGYQIPDEIQQIGGFDIPVLLVDVMPVTKDNLRQWLDEIAPAGWATEEEIFG